MHSVSYDFRDMSAYPGVDEPTHFRVIDQPELGPIKWNFKDITTIYGGVSNVVPLKLTGTHYRHTAGDLLDRVPDDLEAECANIVRRVLLDNPHAKVEAIKAIKDYCTQQNKPISLKAGLHYVNGFYPLP